MGKLEKDGPGEADSNKSALNVRKAHNTHTHTHTHTHTESYTYTEGSHMLPKGKIFKSHK